MSNLADVINQLIADCTVLNNAIDKLASLSFDSNNLLSSRQYLEYLATAQLETDLINSRGHCERIPGIYKDHLSG